MHWDWVVKFFEFLLASGGLALLWKVNRVLNRMWDIIQEYPPHRHVGQRIVFPKGMRPEETEQMNDEAVIVKGRA